MRPRFPFEALVVILLAAAPAAAQETPSKVLLTVDHSLDWERVADPQISPNGRRIVYTRQWVDRMADRWESSLYVLDDDGRRSRFLARGSSARFSPDSTRLAYLAEAPGGKEQIFVLDLVSGGEPTQVTRVDEPPASLRWSPDGRRIAFTMPVPRKPSWTIDLPPAPKGATWTEAPRIIESTHYRADRQGFLKDAFVHLFVVESDGGTPRALTEGSFNVGGRPTGIPGSVGLDWTPDGTEIVFDALMEDDADRRFRESHLYAVSRPGRSAESRPAAAPGRIQSSRPTAGGSPSRDTIGPSRPTTSTTSTSSAATAAACGESPGTSTGTRTTCIGPPPATASSSPCRTTGRETSSTCRSEVPRGPSRKALRS